MIYTRKIIFITALLCLSVFARAAEWQWSVPLNGYTSKETNDHPNAYLWIPANCKKVNGIVVGQHNMLEEGILEHKEFRANLARLGFAEIWITPVADFVFLPASNIVFEKMFAALAQKSGYYELRNAPIIPIGHSAAASYPWNYAAQNPSKTLAVLSIHGDAPQTNMTGSGQPNPDWGARNIDGIPSLFVMGEYEWLEGRITPLVKYQKEHPKSTISILCDAGHGHFDYSDELVAYLNMFIKKASKARLTNRYDDLGRPILIPVDRTAGWVIDRWRDNLPPLEKSAPFNSYKGDLSEGGFAFDAQMASLTERYYARARAKKNLKIVYLQKNKPLKESGFVGYKPVFIPEEDGITFHLSARYQLDSIGHMPYLPSKPIHISRICGPVIKVNDSTFRISFDRLGLSNVKRSNVIWLMASSKADKYFKSAVQQAELRIPLINSVGAKQMISFPNHPEVKASDRKIKLNASSDSGLPVYYYVKEGPASIISNHLVFSKIPPRAKLPIKIVVVAWQYGSLRGNNKVQSAQPVERSYFLK